MSKLPFFSIVAWTFVFSISIQSVQAATPSELIDEARKQHAAGNHEAAMSSLVEATTHPDATNGDRQSISALAKQIESAKDAKDVAAKAAAQKAADDTAAAAANNAAADNAAANAAAARAAAAEAAATKAASDAAVNAAAQKAAADAAAANAQPVAADNVAKTAAPVVENVPAAPAGDDPIVLARKLVIQERIEMGKQAEIAGNYRVAMEQYLYVLTKIDGDNAEAKALLAAAQAKAERGINPKNPIAVAGDELRLQAQRAEAEYNELVGKAEKHAAASNYNLGQQAIQEAKVVLDRNKNALGNNRYETLRDAANSLYANLTADRLEKERLDMEVQQADDAASSDRRRLEAEIDKYQSVQRLLRRAHELRKIQNYDRALQLVNQALFLDPTNPAAEAMKEMMEDSKIAVRAREFNRERSLRIANQSVENLEATIPYNELITYPADWPQLTATRLNATQGDNAESELNRRVSLKLGEPLPINFEANKLVNVVDYFRNTTGVNFFVNWASLEAAGVEQDLPITLQLNNIPADQALDLVLKQAGAGAELEPIGFSIIDGVVHISTNRDLQRTTDTRVYDIRDLLVQIPNFTGAPEFDINSALSNTSSGGSSGGAASASTTLFGDDASDVTAPTREEMIEQIVNLLQDTIGKQDEWAAYGGTVSSLRELNGNLVVKSTPDNHRDIIALLGQLRQARAIQIHIEARFLLVDQNFLEEVGVDFSVDFGDHGNFSTDPLVNSTSTLAPRPISSFPGTFGTAPPQEDGNADPTVIDLSSQIGATFGISYLDDIAVNLVIRATQASRRSVSLTAPRLTLFNGQRANIVVARQVAFISDLEPVSGGNGFDPTLSVTQSGVVLDIEATVSADRRYVTMTARPSLASVSQPIRQIEQTGSQNVNNNNVNNINNGGGVTSAVGFIEAPELELTSVRTSVSVPDKGTLLMGGQRLVGDIEVEAGVPILSKIPVLNRFFTNKTKLKDERTLLILIKPTIIIQEEQEEALWPGLNQDPNAYNAGRPFNPTQGVGEITGAAP